MSSGARHLRVVTNSELSTQRRCAREHYYSYVLGVRPVRVDAALAFGTLIHHALEAWWKAPHGARLEPALAALHAHAGEDIDAYTLARARAMIIGYSERYGYDRYEVLAVEAEFHAVLRDPQTGAPSDVFELGGKLDALVRDSTGELYIVEHKTTGDDIAPGSLYWQALRLNSQVSMYFAGARALGFGEPAGMLYDVLKKSALRPHKATPAESRRVKRDGTLAAGQYERDESPGEFEARILESIALEPERHYARGTVVRFEREEREAHWNTWQQVRLMQESERLGYRPQNSDRCRRFTGMCPYFDACTTSIDVFDDPYRFRIAAQPHEELSL